MILCNLAVLLSERGLTASKLSAQTGISRPALSALVNNSSNGIQYDTINKICNYLEITPEKLIVYIPYDFNLRFEWVNFSLKNDTNGLYITIECSNRDNSVHKYTIYTEMYCEIFDKDVFIDFIINEWDTANKEQEIIDFYNIWNKIPQIFKSKLTRDITCYIGDTFKKAFCNESECNYNIAFPSRHNYIPTAPQ